MRKPDMVIVPEAVISCSRQVSKLGVLDRGGKPVRFGGVNRNGSYLPIAEVPEEDLQEGALPRLSGRWLFGGEFRMHFGHFLTESISRLWPLEQIEGSLDGIVFASARAGEYQIGEKERFDADILRLLQVKVPVRIVYGSTRVERLIVPRQGYGLGSLSEGTPEFRDFISKRMVGNVTPGPHRRVYVTRKRYGLQRGGHFAEHIMEKALSAAGYHLFSPERASFEEQVATYVGAEKIISADCSALHLAGLVARPEQDFAILLRREDGAQDMVPQIVGFTGKVPWVIDRIKGYLVGQSNRNPQYRTFAEVDMAGIGEDLVRAGMIETTDGWWTPQGQRRDRLIARYSGSLRCPIVEAARGTRPYFEPGAWTEAGRAAMAAPSENVGDQVDQPG